MIKVIFNDVYYNIDFNIVQSKFNFSIYCISLRLVLELPFVLKRVDEFLNGTGGPR